MVTTHAVSRTLVAVLAALAAFFQMAHATEEIADSARKQGLAKAPELVKATGIPCVVTDARKVPATVAGGSKNGPSNGPGSDATANPSNGGGHSSVTGSSSGGAASQSFTLEIDYGVGAGGAVSEEYEVACREGLGYVISAATAHKSSAYLCIEALSAPQSVPVAQCLLSGNSDAAQLLAVNAYIVKSGVHCDATRVRGIGHNAQSTMIEAACKSGDGYVLQASNPLNPDLPVHAVNCMGLAAGGQVGCRLTDAAAQLSAAEALLHSVHADCNVTARRYVGSSTDGGHFFEFLCQDRQGYMLKQGAAGEMAGSVACSDAAVASLGGCKLGQPTTK